MRKNLGITGACGLILLSMVLDCFACGNDSVSITNLPPMMGAGVQVNALNSAGLITGLFYFPDRSTHGYLYNAGAVADLGTFGGASSVGSAINSSGQVAGQADLTNGQTHAFIYSGGALTDLGTLGGSSSGSSAINNAGLVAGSSLTAGDASTIGFLYSNGVMIALGDLGGGYSSAFAINNSNVLAGESSLASGDIHAVSYSGGAPTDLGTLGGNFSTAVTLNDAGTVVGQSLNANGEYHGFVYSGGAMTDIGTLGGSYSVAFAINRAGQALGLSSTTGDQEYHGFLYDAGTMTDLTGLGGNFTYPSALNNLGQVVGTSGTSNGVAHAFLWQSGTMTDLNSLVDTNSGWELDGAVAINDAGRIVGYGTLNGTSQWFVMDVTSGGSAPVAVAGPDQTVDCQSQATLDGSQSQGSNLSFQWSVGGNVLGTTATLSVSLPMGNNLVTLKVTDSCGASAETNVNVIVQDTTPPIGTCPGPITASTDAHCQAAVPNVVALVVATDNCTPTGSLVITQDPAAGTLVGSGQYPITVTVKDSSGNASTCSVLFTVVDTTPPVIVSTPAPITLSADANCQAVVPNVLPNVLATDNCTPANQLKITQNPAAGTVLSDGQYTITVTVTDAAGNSTTANVPLTIADTTPPVFQSLSVNPSVLSPPNHQIVPVTVSAAVSDNCDAAPVAQITSITCSEATAPGDIQITGPLTANLAASKGASGNARTYTINVQSTDASGNSSISSVIVTVPKSNSSTGTIGANKKVL